MEIEAEIAEQIALRRMRWQRGIDIGLLVLRAHAVDTFESVRAISTTVMAPSFPSVVSLGRNVPPANGREGWISGIVRVNRPCSYRAGRVPQEHRSRTFGKGRHMASPQVQEIINQMGSAIGANSGLGGTLKFDFGEPGSVYVDGKSTPNTVSDGEGKTADCTISVTLDTFEKMVKGELDGTSAFMQGKLRVAGDMGLAMKLGPVLQKARG
jgi:putative sterol carrier protein